MNAILTDRRARGSHPRRARRPRSPRLLARDFAGLVIGFVERVLATPPQPAPDVTFDFWDSFTIGEQLEELHQYRPAAYRALEPPADHAS